MPEKAIQGNDIRESSDEERSWQQMFILSERWQADLEFLKDELNFIHNLIDRYLMWLTDENNMAATRKQVAELSGIRVKHQALGQTLATHKMHLAGLIENPFSHNAQDCKDAHVSIEAMVTALMKDFRAIKKAVFALTEKIMASEKARHLLQR